MADHILEISWRSIFKIVLTFFLLYTVFLIQDILLLSVFGLVIAILFEAPVRRLSEKMPRWLAVVFLYSLTFSLLTFLIYLPASTLVAEIKQFVNLFPVYFEELAPPLRKLGIEAFQDLENFVEALERAVNVLSSNILNVLFAVFGGIASTVFVISISVFVSLEGDKLDKVLALFFSKKDQDFVRGLWERSEKKVGYWFLNIMLGCLFLGATSYLGFLSIDASYPLSLAILGGVSNFIPIIGPAMATLVIFMVLALDSVSKAIFGALIYAVLNQIENNLVGPLLIKKLAHLSPILVIISIAAGGKLFGLLGSILMVPLVGVIVEFGRGFLERRQNRISKAQEVKVTER